VIIIENEAFVDGVSVGQSLLSGTFEIVIVDGLPVSLLVQGSPQTEYAVSLGANMVASEVSLICFTTEIIPVVIVSMDVRRFLHTPMTVSLHLMSLL
jgi:hypothetical protein